MHYLMVLIFLTGPGGHPPNLRLVFVTSSSVTFSWDPLPCAEKNGPITGYQYVFYSGIIQQHTGTLEGENTSLYTAYDLDEYSPHMYAFKVAAVNLVGTGEYSSIVTVSPHLLRESSGLVTSCTSNAKSDTGRKPDIPMLISIPLLNLASIRAQLLSDSCKKPPASSSALKVHEGFESDRRSPSTTESEYNSKSTSEKGNLSSETSCPPQIIIIPLLNLKYSPSLTVSIPLSLAYPLIYSRGPVRHDHSSLHTGGKLRTRSPSSEIRQPRPVGHLLQQDFQARSSDDQEACSFLLKPVKSRTVSFQLKRCFDPSKLSPSIIRSCVPWLYEENTFMPPLEQKVVSAPTAEQVVLPPFKVFLTPCDVLQPLVHRESPPEPLGETSSSVPHHSQENEEISTAISFFLSEDSKELLKLTNKELCEFHLITQCLKPAPLNKGTDSSSPHKLFPSFSLADPNSGHSSQGRLSVSQAMASIASESSWKEQKSQHLEESQVPLAGATEEYSLTGFPPQSLPLSPLHEQVVPWEISREETVVTTGQTSGVKRLRSVSSSDSSSSFSPTKKIRMQ